MYHPIQQTSTYIEYPVQPTTSAQAPTCSQPMTPILQLACIQLAIPLPNQLLQPPVTEGTNQNLATHLQTPLQQWAIPL